MNVRRFLFGAVAGVIAGTLAACGAAQRIDDERQSARLTDAGDQASNLVARAALVSLRASALDDAELDIRFELLRELAAANEFDAALAHVAVLRRARPGWHTFRFEEARMLLFGRADPEGALVAADACLEVRPDHAGCHEMRGRALIDLGRPDDAIAALSDALEYEPGRTDAAEVLARVYMQSDRNDEAIAVADDLIALRGRSVNLLLVRATASERLGDHARAETDFVSIANSHPDPIAGWSYLAGYYRRANRENDLARIETLIEGLRRNARL